MRHEQEQKELENRIREEKVYKIVETGMKP